MWAALLLLSTALLFTLPLAGALWEWRRARDVEPLPIAQAHAGHIRHFADQFHSKIEEEIARIRAMPGSAQAQDPGIQLVEAGAGLEPRGAAGEAVRQVVIADGPLRLRDGCDYEREVYGRSRVETGEGSRLRAVLAEGELDLRPRTVLLRWAHAQTIRAGPDCNLPGRLSAVESISLDCGCRFRRVNAPAIRFGPGSAQPRPPPPPPPTAHDPKAGSPISRLVDGRWTAERDLELPEGSFLMGDLVARGDVLLDRGAGIGGRVKVHGRTRLAPGARIDGSLVGVGPVVIGAGCFLLGPVVSEQAIEIGPGTTVGEPSRPTTVTAPSIRIAPGALVHGTIWARESAEVGRGEAAG